MPLLTDIFHGKSPARLEDRLCGLHRAWRKWWISSHHWRLPCRRHDVGCWHGRSCLLHLDVAVKRFTGGGPALNGPGHGRWAGHLWNVVLHGLRSLVVRLERSAHGRPGSRWTVRRLPRSWPLAFMVHARLGGHHLFRSIHAMISRALCRSSERSLPVWIVGVTDLTSALPHPSLCAVWTRLHRAAHHLRGH